jgi:hypothetical protein
MGDRATLLFVTEVENNMFIPEPVGIYVHWDGEMSRVLAALDFAKGRKVRSSGDWSYGVARLVQIFSNKIGGTLSIGIVPAPLKGRKNNHSWPWQIIEEWAAAHADGNDNGAYVIGGDFRIIAQVQSVVVEDKNGELVRLEDGTLKKRTETLRGPELDAQVEALRKGADGYFDALARVTETNMEHFGCE